MLLECGYLDLSQSLNAVMKVIAIDPFGGIVVNNDFLWTMTYSHCLSKSIETAK